MNPVPVSVTVGLAIALAASLASNAGLGWAYLGVRDERTEANGARDQARAAADTCSDGVRELQSLAAERDREAVRSRAKADSTALDFERRAQEILAAPASTPGDDCRSASDAIDAWLQGRSKP